MHEMKGSQYSGYSANAGPSSLKYNFSALANEIDDPEAREALNEFKDEMKLIQEKALEYRTKKMDIMH